jgi:hypothetical protein
MTLHKRTCRSSCPDQADLERGCGPYYRTMVVALLHVAVVLLAGGGFLAYRASRHRRPADRPRRRVSPVALEGAATVIGLAGIVAAVIMKFG